MAAEAKDYRLALLRDAALALADYMISIRDGQLQEFWLPCKAPQHFIGGIANVSRYFILAILGHNDPPKMHGRVYES